MPVSDLQIGGANFFTSLLNTLTNAYMKRQEREYLASEAEKKRKADFITDVTKEQLKGQTAYKLDSPNVYPSTSPEQYGKMLSLPPTKTIATPEQIYEGKNIKLEEKPKESDLVPIIEINEKGENVITGYAPKGSHYGKSFGRELAVAEGRAKAGAEAGIEKTAQIDFQKYTAKSGDILKSLDQINEASKKLNNYTEGFLPQIYAKGDVWYKEHSADPAITNYVGLIKGNLANIAIANGNVGVLSDLDIKSTEEALGKANLPLEQKLQLVNNLRDKFISGLKNRMDISKITPEELKTNQPNLYNIIYGKNQEESISDEELIKQVNEQLKLRLGE